MVEWMVESLAALMVEMKAQQWVVGQVEQMDEKMVKLWVVQKAQLKGLLKVGLQVDMMVAALVGLTVVLSDTKSVNTLAVLKVDMTVVGLVDASAGARVYQWVDNQVDQMVELQAESMDESMVARQVACLVVVMVAKLALLSVVTLVYMLVVWMA